MDKDGRAIDGLAALGFGFLEVGTVTPLAQPGNPKPRMFRLRSAHAVINRMGFNNAGLEQFIENIGRARYRGILGLNIGKNAQTPHEDALQDYLIGLRGVYAHASYVAINISSPNTQGLRALQNDDALDRLLGALKQEQALLQQRFGRYVPLAVKIAPDLSPEAVRHIAKQLKAHGMDGVIATNTTIDRRAVLGESHANEAGGLSGAPLTATSTQVIAHLKAELGSALPIIGVGGILTASDAIDKIRAGASLVQLYTGLVYRGPALISECLKAIDQLQDTPR
jgi:dihydroorotate dehydrogenase